MVDVDVLKEICKKLDYKGTYGIINDGMDIIYRNLKLMQLDDMLANYLFLLKMDPTQTPNYPDPKYTIIHPHNKNYVVKLNHFDYRFVKSINDFYCQGRTNLNNFVTIG